MSFLINPNAVITNPIFPPLVEIDPDLAIRLLASDITGLASGDTITSVVARGQAPLRTRTFDATNGGWQMPTFSTERGEPSIRFNGSQQIRNFASSVNESVLARPAALFWRVWVDGFIHSGAGSARLLSSGSTTPTNLAFRPSNVAGQFILQSPNFSHTIDTPMTAASWGVVGVLFNGADSRVVRPDGTVSAVVLDAIDIMGFRIGGNSNSGAAGYGLIGDISEVRAYTRAMSDAELRATWQAMAA